MKRLLPLFACWLQGYFDSVMPPAALTRIAEGEFLAILVVACASVLHNALAGFG